LVALGQAEAVAQEAKVEMVVKALQPVGLVGMVHPLLVALTLLGYLYLVVVAWLKSL
jgi:hypothetical protein